MTWSAAVEGIVVTGSTPAVPALSKSTAERLRHDRSGSLWFNGSGQHFRRFNQIRQPNGAGIGTPVRYGRMNTRRRRPITRGNA